MWNKKGVAVAAALLLSGAGLHAAPVITGWNTDNVAVSTAINGVAGESVIYDRAPGDAGARTSGKVVFDGSESDTPGLKIVNDAAPGVPSSNGDVYNCVMANSQFNGQPGSCNDPQQSGKRFKFQRTAHEATDIVFDVDKNGTFSITGNDGLYKFFSAFGNDTGGRLGSFQVSLGTGIGADFVGSTDNDGLSFSQFGGVPNNSQFSALFANGLFGGIDPLHPLVGYFDDQRAGFDMAFGGEDIFSSTGLFGRYASLFGPMLSYDQLPRGYFYDTDGNPDTDDTLIAHELEDGTWVQNRRINADGTVSTLAGGNDGIAYATIDALFAALSTSKTGGLLACSVAPAGVPCLAGASSIDDLAKFNLTFFVDPTGFDGDQFTLRIESAAVPEPGSLALAALALGAVGASRRRRG